MSCADEYWQPNDHRGTIWVCNAVQRDVKIIFWMCIVQMIFAGFSLPSGSGQIFD